MIDLVEHERQIRGRGNMRGIGRNNFMQPRRDERINEDRYSGVKLKKFHYLVEW